MYSRLDEALKTLGVDCEFVDAYPARDYPRGHRPQLVGRLVEALGRKRAATTRSSPARAVWKALQGMSLLLLMLRSLPRFDVFIFAGGVSFLWGLRSALAPLLWQTRHRDLSRLRLPAALHQWRLRGSRRDAGRSRVHRADTPDSAMGSMGGSARRCDHQPPKLLALQRNPDRELAERRESFRHSERSPPADDRAVVCDRACAHSTDSKGIGGDRGGREPAPGAWP